MLDSSLSPPPSFLLFSLSFPPPTPHSSSPVTHSSINIGITITLDDYWETWAVLCTHSLFSDRISGDHSLVFTDKVLNSFCARDANQLRTMQINTRLFNEQQNL